MLLDRGFLGQPRPVKRIDDLEPTPDQLVGLATGVHAARGDSTDTMLDPCFALIECAPVMPTKPAVLTP